MNRTQWHGSKSLRDRFAALTLKPEFREAVAVLREEREPKDTAENRANPTLAVSAQHFNAGYFTALRELESLAHEPVEKFVPKPMALERHPDEAI